jgi:flavin-binding protein dodecin
MSVAKIVELTSTSKESFDDAINKGIERACKTLDHVRGAWVEDQKVTIENGKVVEYRVNLKITFILDE